MPLLDVNDVFSDPTFVDSTLVLIRNVQTIGANGRAVDTPTTIPLSGIVTQDTGDMLKRRAEGSYVAGSITLHTVTQLLCGAPGRDADIVTWRGNRYVVEGVNDYSTYGRGFYSAICTQLPLSG